MTLRLRLTLVAAGVVAAVVAAASVITYFLMRHELYSQVDSALAGHVEQQLANPHAESPSFGGYSNDYVAFVGPAGNKVYGLQMHVTQAMRDAARGRVHGVVFRNDVVQGHDVREAIGPLSSGGAVVVLRVTDDITHELSRLRLILLLVFVGSIGAAALAGALVSRATLAPVRRLTAAAERIAQTGEPSERVPEGGRGELARLGGSFNTMLAALEESLETQRRFVADASHELRTPLTSLQTNIDVLRGEGQLDHAARQALLADLQRESQEMRSLIAGLLELARGGDPRLEREPFRLDEVVEASAERARSRFPAVRWDTDLEPTTVQGYAGRMERAVWNLLENAGKWSAEGSSVEISLRGGELRVRDHGPGIAAEDRPKVFDRFYRSAAARSMPGSGLGLAIVREIAEAHGGAVAAEEAPDGGALIRLSLNGAVVARGGAVTS